MPIILTKRRKEVLRRSPIHRSVEKTDKTVDRTDTAGAVEYEWTFRGCDLDVAANGFQLSSLRKSSPGGENRRGERNIKKKKKERDMRGLWKRRGREGGRGKEYRRGCGRKEGEGREKRNGSVEKCHRAILIYNGREIGAANFVSVAETQKFLLVGIGTFIDVRGRFLARARKIKKKGGEGVGGRKKRTRLDSRRVGRRENGGWNGIVVRGRII